MAKITALKYCRKIDLQKLANELGVKIEEGDTMAIIIQKIEEANDYDEEMAVTQAGYIVQDREETAAREKENERLNREEREREKEREYEKAKLDREFELEQLRLTQGAERSNSRASNRSDRGSKIQIKSIMHNFDPEKSDITLFLNLFERQAERSGIDSEDLVTHLLALLPIDIAELVLREDKEKVDNFNYVKSVLLSRYRLSAEAYRVKLLRHQKNPTSPWKDLIFELNSFQEGWLSGLEINTIEELKSLLITEQIKRRVPTEMKEHFIDSWASYKNPDSLVKDLDGYETIKGISRKPWNNRAPIEKRFERPRYAEKETEKNPEIKLNWRDKNENKEREKIFDKPRKNTCFYCSSPNHYKRNCPELKKSENSHKTVHNISKEINLEKGFEPYLSRGKINGEEIIILRDTGSSVDICPNRLVKTNQLTGQVSWVRQPLVQDLRCLPIAEITLELPGEITVNTTALVADKNSDINYYILGNESQKIIESNKSTKPKMLNAVMTRSRTKTQMESEGSGCQIQDANQLDKDPSPDNGQGPTESAETVDNNRAESDNSGEGGKEQPILLPDLIVDDAFSLSKVGKKEFANEQKTDNTLNEIKEKALKKSHSSSTETL